ncbi:MAG: PaaI family thioesterase [Rhodospirillaceae bacterium]
MASERIQLHPVGTIVFGSETVRLDGEYLICAGCRELGYCRFGATREDILEDGTHRVELTCPAGYAGAPGIAHGGWTSAILDELLGHLAIYQGRFTVTSTLTVKYIRPVPVERPLIGLSWVERRENGVWHNVGEIRLASTNALLAKGNGVFMEREQAHFAQHEERLRQIDQNGGLKRQGA